MKQFEQKQKQPLIYIAGPYSAANAWDRHKNIAAAEDLSMQAVKAGFAVHCPHSNFRHAYGWLPESVFVRADITVMLRCDALLILPGWEDSKGTQEEIAIAGKERIPAFFTLPAAVTHFADRLEVVAA